MPLYEYKCVKCGRLTEKIENLSGPHLKKCPHCGGKVESVVSAPAIQFKGSGWYVTDYAGRKPGADSAKEEKGDKSASDSKEAAKDTKEPAAKDSSKEKKTEKPAKKK